MRKGERFRLVAVIGLVVAMMSAGFALAGDALNEQPSDEPTTCVPVDNTVEDGDTVEGEEPVDGEEGESDESDESDEADESEEGEESDEAEECEEADEADETDETEEPADDVAEEGDEEAALEPAQERIDECMMAAGMEGEEAPEGKPEPGDELKGLENAISHVLWNCMRNDNDGLVNALEHLSVNLERKELRDEAKEERKAEHDAAKADRDAAKAERKAEHEAAKAARELARAS
jgi:hypothetical protein